MLWCCRLYCTLLICTLLYSTELYSTELYSTVIYWSVTLMLGTLLYCTVTVMLWPGPDTCKGQHTIKVPMFTQADFLRLGLLLELELSQGLATREGELE